MTGLKAGKDRFMEDYLRGQDYVARLQAEDGNPPRRKGLQGVSSVRQASPKQVGANAGRHWELESVDDKGSRQTSRIPLSTKRPPLGPVTYDDGTTRFHAPTEWEEDPPSLPKGTFLEQALEEASHRPVAKGNFDEVAGFMYGELTRNSRSWQTRMLSVANANPHPLTKAGALAGWTALVWPGHVWDHKPVLTGAPTDSRKDAAPFDGTAAEWFKDGKDQYGYELWSNVHYGYVGRQAGLDAYTLMAGAGGAQLKTLYRKGGSEKERRMAWHRAIHEMQGARGLDDPMDSAAVRLGIHLYEKYGPDLTLDQFKKEVRSWPGMKTIHEPAQTDRYINRPAGN